MLPGPKCLECPFYSKDRKNFCPVSPEYGSTNAVITLIGESPGYEEKWRGKPFIGPTGRLLWKALKKRGLERSSCHLVNRISCCPPAGRKTYANMKKAAACCLPVFERYMKPIKNVPRLYMGKWAPDGSLNSQEITLSKGVLCGSYMVVDHPTFAFIRKAPLQIQWLASVTKFITFVNKCTPYKPWKNPSIGATEKSLATIKKLGREIAWDVETYGVDFQDPEFKITCLGFSDGKHTLTIPWDSYSTRTQGYVRGLSEFGKLGAKIREAVIALFNDTDRVFITHNGSYDVPAMAARSVQTRNDFDTFLAHGILWPELRHNLEDVAIQVGDVGERWKTLYGEDKKGDEKYIEISPAKLRLYNTKDAEATIRCYQALQPLVSGDPRLQRLFDNAMENARIAQKMKEWGWLIDKKRQAKEDARLIETIESKLQAAKTLLKDTIEPEALAAVNFGSSQQLGRIFYKILGESVKYQSPQGAPSTGKEALTHIAKTGGTIASNLAAVLLEHKGAKKLKESYIDNLKTTVARPSINVVGQVAGRWSVTKPALQTTPSSMKGMFVARPGNWLVLADYSQLELRINAQGAGDDTLLLAYREERDAHRTNAATLFGLKESEITNVLRHSAKTFVYRLSYCTMDEEAAAMGIFGTLSVHYPELTYRVVLRAVRRWWSQHPKLYQKKKDTWEFVKNHDYVEEPYLGRRRYFYGQPKDTEAFNFGMQAGGAAIVDKATQHVHAMLNHEKEHLLLQRHDELGLEGPDPERLVTILETGMVKTYVVNEIPMTFPIEWKVGLRWGAEVTLERKAGLYCVKGKKFQTIGNAVDFIVEGFKHEGT